LFVYNTCIIYRTNGIFLQESDLSKSNDRGFFQSVTRMFSSFLVASKKWECCLWSTNKQVLSVFRVFFTWSYQS